jgi:hypothetical protein
MKKSVLILAFTAFFGVATFATDKNEAQQNPVQTQQQHDQQEGRQHGEMDYKTSEIKVEDVPQEVRSAVLLEDRNASIESAETKALPTGEIVYKLKINSSEEGETTKMFYANGTEYTDHKSKDKDKNKDYHRSR